MRKSTIIFILIIFTISFISENSYLLEEMNLNPFDYARITDVDYKAILVDEPGSNGKVVVTERLTFDIHAASQNNLFWELWRDLPESYIDGVKVDYQVNSVKQILDDGTEVIYDESPKLYWNDSDYINTARGYGPGKWYHSEGPYNESARNYECVFFYVDGLYREKVTFEIEYEMNNAALRYGDCSELYLSLYSEETIKHLESYKAQILIPNEDMPSSGNYDAYTYGTNSNRFPFTESDTKNFGYHTFSFELDEEDLKFRPYNEYIEFSLISYGADKHKFTDYATRNYYYNDDVLDELRQEQAEFDAVPEDYKKTKIIILLICSASAILIIIYDINKDKKMRKEHIFYEPTMQIKYFRDIPSNLDPVFASNLVFCKNKERKNDSDGYSSIMLSLVRKGYIELTRIDEQKDWTSNNVKIIVKHQPTPIMNDLLESQTIESEKPETLTPTEELYFNLIIRHSHGNEISVKDFQAKVSIDYENTNTFVKNIENSVVNIGVSQGYFQKADYEQPKRQTKSLSTAHGILGVILITLVNLILYQTHLDLAFGAFFILGIAFIFSSLYLRRLSKKYVLLTQFGEDEYAKWKGLYDFLNSETLMKERTVIELPIWEQYLVYATAFGISEKVITALKVRCPDMEMSPMLSNPYYRSRSFHYSCRSFRSVTRTASHIARSGGYGGHGGYGGGGRGGGGGRRRSLKPIYKKE